jgi:hypothetical protein
MSFSVLYSKIPFQGTLAPFGLCADCALDTIFTELRDGNGDDVKICISPLVSGDFDCQQNGPCLWISPGFSDEELLLITPVL